MKEEVKEEDSEEEEEEYKDITFEGVEYQLNTEDNSVIDPDDYELIGTWNGEGIDFEGENERRKHEEEYRPSNPEHWTRKGW